MDALMDVSESGDSKQQEEVALWLLETVQKNSEQHQSEAMNVEANQVLGSVGAHSIPGLRARELEEESESSFQVDGTAPDIDEEGQQEPVTLVSAVLVEEEDGTKSGGESDEDNDNTKLATVATVINVEKRRLVVCTVLGLIFLSLGVSVWAITTRGSQPENATSPTLSPTPTLSSMAPTIDYLSRINSYDHIYSFVSSVVWEPPQDCDNSTTATTSSKTWMHEATCFDGDIVGAIYFIGSNSECEQVSEHSLRCTSAESSDPIAQFRTGVSCGSTTGMATLQVETTPLYDSSTCLYKGAVSVGVQSFCENDETIDKTCGTPQGGNLTSSTPECALDGGRDGLITSLTLSNPSCATQNVETSKLFQLKGVLFV